MPVTSLSLLDRLRGAGRSADWERFDAVYRPLIRAWVGRVPGVADADDVAQDVMLVLVKALPAFERLREGSFRVWLRRVTAHRLRTYTRQRRKHGPTGAAADAFLDQVAAPSGELADAWDREHDRVVFDRLLDAVRPDFSPATWEAFRRFGVGGRPAAEVATELGTTVNAVLLAKSRVLKRLREEAGHLLD